MQDDLDRLLSKRVAPDAQPQLAERIIQASVRKPKRSAFRGVSWFAPALAVACLVIYVTSPGFQVSTPSGPVAPIVSAQDETMEEIDLYIFYDSVQEIEAL